MITKCRINKLSYFLFELGKKYKHSHSYGSIFLTTYKQKRDYLYATFCGQIGIKSIVVISLVAMFFSCTNNPKEVRNFLKEKNLPIGVAKNIYNVYKDSGRIASKLVSPLLKDYSNRKRHPYSEFPEGIKIVSFKNKGKDSITITGEYALTYSKTQISEIRGNVVVVNHKDKSILETDQLFWDQNTDYFYSEKPFKSTTLTDTISGIGFESKKDLSKFLAKRITGYFTTIDN